MSSVNKGVGRKKQKLEEANMPTTNHLLVIGINNYSNGIITLNNAVKDAKAFEALLKKKYNFKEENIISLYDQDATGKKILKAFDTLRNRLTSDDNLIFYFSGHGELEQGINRGYWIPVFAHSGDRSTYINNTEVTDFVAACKARHILGIVDACYSGTLLRSSKNIFLEKYFTKPSRKIMTSGLEEPVPDGPPNTHSPFARALLSALEHNHKAYLSGPALWQEMQESLAAITGATAQFQNMANVGPIGGDFFFLNADSEDIPKIEKVDTTEGISRVTNPKNQQTTPITEEPNEDKKDLSSLSLSDWKTALKRIAVTNLKRALTQAEDRIDSSSDAFNSLLLLQSRYHSAKKNQDSGLVTDQQSNISFNRIKAAFSGFIDDLEDYDMK